MTSTNLARRFWFASWCRLLSLMIALAIFLTPIPEARAWEPPRESPASVSLNGNIQIRELIEFVSHRLSVSVQFSPSREIEQRITLRLHDPLTNDELWSVLESTLETHGLALVKAHASGVFHVIPIAQAASQQFRIRFPGDVLHAENSPLSTFVSVVIRLESASPTEIVASLSSVLSNANSVRAIGTTGLLLIADVRRRVEQALLLIELLDSPADPPQRAVHLLTNASASEVANLVAQILAAETSVNAASVGKQPLLLPLPGDEQLLLVAPQSRINALRALISDLDIAPSIETRSYAAPDIPASDLVDTISRLLDGRVSSQRAAVQSEAFIDPSTGAVFVTAPVKIHERLAALLERLTKSPPSARRIIKPIRVLNRAASDLVETVTELLGLGGVEIDPGTATNPSRTGESDAKENAVAASPVAWSADLTITVDEATNTIIAAGTLSQIEQLESLIDLLDERQPQVMIEVSLVTLSEGEALDVGVELQGQFTVGSTSVNLASLFGLGSGGAGALGGGTGLTGAIVNPGDFQAIVRALESVNRGRSASTPKVLVNNNATATLRSVARQPFTSINASNTVATTSFGGNQDAGTTVTITPQIAQGDHLILEYSVELSSFTGESTTTEGGGVIPPPSQQNSVDGSVTIPDGYTVVIGGVENTTNGRSRSRVPLVGRLPVIGWLFGTTSKSETRDRFYVFIRASVLRDPLFEDLKQLSGRDLAEAGVDDGLPSLEPLWID